MDDSVTAEVSSPELTREQTFGALQDTVVLVYDGHCQFCMRCVKVLKRLDRNNKITLIASQHPGVRQILKLTDQEAASSVWLYRWSRRPTALIQKQQPQKQRAQSFESKANRHVLQRCGGAAAVSSALDVAFGGNLAKAIYHLPGMTQLTEYAYRYVADHRGTACGLGPGTSCTVRR